MMTGNVNSKLQPTISLSLIAPDGTEFELDALIDTGFSGDITLPIETIRQMGLTFYVQDVHTIGNNQDAAFNVYTGAKVYWHQKDVDVLVMEVEGESYMGMELLEGSSLFVEAKPNGKVRVRELPPPRTRKK
jgi:clan AA aspartic protease